jgi:hypothetical protein
VGLIAHGRDKNSYVTVVGEPENKPAEKPRLRWKDNVKMDFKGIGCECGLDSSGSPRNF